jgi:hypothetical protein
MVGGKCKKCGERQRPIFKDYNKEKRWTTDNINWWNMLIPDWQSLLLIFIVIIMAWAYTHDVEQYKDLAANPCGYCATANQAPTSGNVLKNYSIRPIVTSTTIPGVG